MEIPNNNYIDQLAGDNIEFRKKLINILKTELPQEIQVYNDAIKEMNFKELIFIVHKIKHKVSILSLDKSYKIVENFENNLKNKKIDLHLEFENIIDNMQTYINNL